MKQKLSITIEEKTIKLLNCIIKNGGFRNKSQAIEFSINKILRKNENAR
jgi:metal-responsive CopG/Arc/MetJ family transcriptional regulator